MRECKTWKGRQAPCPPTASECRRPTCAPGLSPSRTINRCGAVDGPPLFNERLHHRHLMRRLGLVCVGSDRGLSGHHPAPKIRVDGSGRYGCFFTRRCSGRSGTERREYSSEAPRATQQLAVGNDTQRRGCLGVIFRLYAILRCCQ
jgi:hypothetical protein